MPSLELIREIFSSMEFPSGNAALISSNDALIDNKILSTTKDSMILFERTATAVLKTNLYEKHELAECFSYFAERSTLTDEYEEEKFIDGDIEVFIGANSSITSIAVELSAALCYKPSRILITCLEGYQKTELDVLTSCFFNAGWPKDCMRMSSDEEKVTFRPTIALNCDIPLALRKIHYGGTHMVILDGADLQAAVEQLVWWTWGRGATQHQDWTVSSVAVLERLLPQFRETIRKICMSLEINTVNNNPKYTDSLLKERVTAAVRVAQTAGAEIDQFQSVPNDESCWYPTVIYDFQDPEIDVRTPVVSVFSCRSAQEAVQIIAKRPFCLASSLWSGDSQECLTVANLLDTNIVWVNFHGTRHPAIVPLPSKRSGFGPGYNSPWMSTIYSPPEKFKETAWGSNIKVVEETVKKLAYVEALKRYRKHFYRGLRVLRVDHVSNVSASKNMNVLVKQLHSGGRRVLTLSPQLIEHWDEVMAEAIAAGYHIHVILDEEGIDNNTKTALLAHYLSLVPDGVITVGKVNKSTTTRSMLSFNPIADNQRLKYVWFAPTSLFP